MKKLVLLFAALLVAGCGEKSSSEGSESASEKPTGEPSADAAKPSPAEAPVAESPTGGGEKAEDSVITGGGEKAEDSIITGKWAHESNSDLVMWEFFEDGTYKALGVREKGTYQILDGNRLQMEEGPHSTIIENLQISKTELTGKSTYGGNIRWLRK